MLKRAGACTIKIHQATRSGFPDIVGCFRGKFIAIEVKREGNKLTLLQQQKLDLLAAAGAHIAVCHNKGDAQKFIDHMKAL